MSLLWRKWSLRFLFQLFILDVIFNNFLAVKDFQRFSLIYFVSLSSRRLLSEMMGRLKLKLTEAIKRIRPVERTRQPGPLNCKRRKRSYSARPIIGLFSVKCVDFERERP